MPRTALSTVSAAAYGLGVADISAESADQSNGNSVANDGRTVLIITNGSGADLDVTATMAANKHTANNATTKVQTIANGDTGFMGPFPTKLYTTTLAIDWESDTSVTVAAVKMLETEGNDFGT